MKTPTFHTRWYLTILVLFFYLFITLPVEGGTLKGTVKGNSGQLKKHVRVEIGGPETKTIFTNKVGIFLIKLKGGKYTVKIIEKNRSMRFKVKVPRARNKTKEVIFKLKW